MGLTTPYYLIDERKLLRNLKTIEYVRRQSAAKVVLALKCFSTWCVFGLMKKYMDGTTSSSLFEARLGREKFGKEVHAYSVAWSADEIERVKKYADKIIFNSISQFERFEKDVWALNVGLRVNPGVSYSHYDLADPARKYSRLGVEAGGPATRRSADCATRLLKLAPRINGVMFHYNCENDDFQNFSTTLNAIARAYEPLLKKLEWVSLGGGLYFTKEGYPLEQFCKKLKEFGERFEVQVYLEPGEAAITRCAELVTTVLDIVHNEIDIAIVDASTEAHMLDLLIYRQNAKIEGAGEGRCRYVIAGRSCLAGDIFGTYRFRKKLKVGDIVKMADAAGYTMVKKNWFNGLPMPAIVVRRLNGSVKVIRRFDYGNYLRSLS
jgi:carboxynorspermidine decarboxylase